MTISAAEFQKRYQQGVQGAGEKYKTGVTTGKPWAERYASPDSQERMRQGLANAIAEGTPAAGATALGTAGYRAKTVEKSGNYTGSATRASQAIAPHIPQILQAAEAGRAAADAITGPKDRATAKAKMEANMDAIMTAWGK